MEISKHQCVAGYKISAPFKGLLGSRSFMACVGTVFYCEDAFIVCNAVFKMVY